MVVAKNAMSDIVAGQTFGPGQAASSPSAQQGKVDQISTHHTVPRTSSEEMLGPLALLAVK